MVKTIMPFGILPFDFTTLLEGGGFEILEKFKF
jgi:hypothetical protein